MINSKSGLSAATPCGAGAAQLAAFAQAFEAWETDFRASPDTFFIPEEVKALGVSEVSMARAEHFARLLTGLR